MNPDGTVSNPVTINLPTSGPGGAALPSGMAFSSDGLVAYVALNGYNTLGVVDTENNTLTNQIQVGIAPRQVVVVGSNAYVSNEGGYPTGQPSYNYTTVNYSDDTPVISNRYWRATTGTVSVVNLNTSKESQEIQVGLEPSADSWLPTAPLSWWQTRTPTVSLSSTPAPTVSCRHSAPTRCRHDGWQRPQRGH